MPTNAVIHCVNGVSPYMQCRSFTPGTGWGSLLASPSGMPSGSWAPQYPAYDSKTNICVFAGNTGSSVRIFTYRMTSAGFSTALADGPTLSVVPTGFLFHPTLPIAVVALGNSSPYVRAYTFNSDGWGAALTNSEPSTLPARESSGRAMCWNADGTILFVGHVNSPFLRVYNFSSTGFGSVITSPTPTSHVRSVYWDNANSRFAAANGGASNRIQSWAFNGTTFSDLYSSSIPSITNSSIIRPFASDSRLVLANASSLEVWNWDGSTGRTSGNYTQQSIASSDYAAADVSSAGTDAVVSKTTSPYIEAYPVSSSGTSAKYSNPASLPAGAARFPIFVELPPPTAGIFLSATRSRILRD
jgi:hypothetical protein